jgi:menaquinone-dependent protoporphyrinogen oxidase
MNGKILVTHASKYGATEEIAEKIGEVLRKAGLQVDVLPVNGNHNLSEYKSVIMGSAIYIGKWPKNAVAFLKGNLEILADRPVWLFSSGPTGKGDPVELVDGCRFPSGLKPMIDRIKPRDVVVFHGFINPEKMNPIEKWAVKSVVKKPFGDFRDWESIINWTTSIAHAMKEM